VPPEYTYYPPTEFTENPAYTTQSTAGPSTSAFTEPAGYLNYDMLQNVQATITNAFQTGEIGSAFADLGASVDTLTMEEPLVPPQEPPPYEGPEARAEVTEQTFAEQQAAANEELLEQYEERSVPVPATIHLVETPEEALEMQVIKPVSVYVLDDTGKLVSVLGDDSDPWMVTVSVLSGPGAVMGNTTVAFVGGIATFDDIFVDTMGSGYVFEFTLSYPTTADIAAIQSNMFAVGGRPLGLRFNDFNILQPQNTSFAINATIWDEALDQAADTSVLLDMWECEATFDNGNFSGTSVSTVAAGDGLVIFDDLIVESMSLNNVMTIECFADATSTTISDTSVMFHIYDAPTTGLLTQVDTTFSYKGKFSVVEDILSSFNSNMGTLTCTGCPGGIAGDSSRSVQDLKSFDDLWSPLKN